MCRRLRNHSETGTQSNTLFVSALSELSEIDHEKSLSDPSNIIPKSVIILEKFYDLQDKFRQTTNYKTQSSTLNHTVFNMGMKPDPCFINLGVHCSHDEKRSFIKLCKEFKDIFFQMYDELSTFDTSIIHHNILMKPEVKPYQQKLRKMHPSLEPFVKKELNNLLVARIIFHVRHTQWVSNLVPVQKKNG